MPIYDYQCPCGHKFESFHQRIDKEPEKCPECGGEAQRVDHFHDQNLKRPDYIPPPKASRKFGESKVTPHVRKRWG